MMIYTTDDVINLSINALTVYALTFVVTSSSILAGVRYLIIEKTPKLKFGNNKHFIECRMCVGLWLATAVCNAHWQLILPVYGLSYLLATQER